MTPTLLVALLNGGLFGSWLATSQRVRGIWPYVAMAVLGVALGAYLAAFGMTVLDGLEARRAISPGSVIAAGAIGIILFGLPGFAATLLTSAVWREPLVEAVTGGRPSRGEVAVGAAPSA